MSVRKSQENFFRCYPDKVLRVTLDLSLEETAVFMVLMNAMFQTWRPLPYHSKGEKAWVARWVNAAPQKVNPIIRRLIERGVIKEVLIKGEVHLSIDLFESERAELRGIRRAVKSGESPYEVDTKSDQSSTEVDTKSEQSTPLCDATNEQNQEVAALDKSKIREEEDKKKNNKRKRPKGANDNAPVRPPCGPWSGPPEIRQRAVNAQGEGFALSYVDTAEPHLGGIRAATRTAFDKLKTSGVFQAGPHGPAVAIYPPEPAQARQVSAG